MQITTIALAVLILFGVVTLIQLVYYYIIYGRFAFYRKKNPLGFRDIPVSVVVVVRDDASQLLQTLPYLLEQQYSFFEIVVVNDTVSRPFSSCHRKPSGTLPLPFWKTRSSVLRSFTACCSLS